MHAWWSLFKSRPKLGKAVSSVMAVLLGGQPSGMQSNFNHSPCNICCERAEDCSKHVLLHCSALNDIRKKYFEKIIDKMPSAMKMSFNTN